MKNIIKKSVFTLLILSLSLLSVFFCTATIKSETNMVFADNALNSQQVDVSIFIRKPTYSVFLDGKYYFIDESDKFLKAFNEENSSFESKYLDLSSFEIAHASFFGNSWYLLVLEESQNKVIKINLETFEIVENFEVSVEKDYTSFFARDVVFEESTYTLLTFSSVNKNPKVSLIDSQNEIQQTLVLQFDSSSVMSGLLNTISYQDASGKLFFVFVYRNQIAHCAISSLSALEELASKTIQSITNTPIPNDMSDPHILNVGFVKVDSTNYFAICYSNENVETIRIYSFNFDALTDSLTYIESDYSCMNSKYLTFNNEYFTYANTEAQLLHLNKIWKDADERLLIQQNPPIDNPNYEINYFDSENFIYKETNSNTMLYEEPWGSNPISLDSFGSNIIPKNVDVIQIGTAKISKNNEIISDYDYCLYTYENYNYCGFIKNSSLSEKDEISPSEAGYKTRSSIWPRTTLYSLPTTVTHGKIGKDNCNLVSKRLMIIEDNSEIEVIDVLKMYYANETQMIKVRVNGSEIGYIDANCIRDPATINEFVITNATIKNDGTIIYLSASLDATTLTFTLDKGKNVRINGARNTKTGFTSITFNDEYGNEFSGYIETDYIKADAWSTLQIIGCVLIAINIGLLILILLYRKNHLGNRGQKINN